MDTRTDLQARLVARAATLCLLLLSACAEPAPGGMLPVGQIQDPARPHYHDFGEVAPGATLEKVFAFENREGRPVRVLKVDSSCICTVPSLRAVVREGGEERVIKGDPYNPVEKLIVPAGAVAEITLRVDPSAVREPNVDKLVTIRVTTDSPSSAYLKMEAHLVVREYFQIAPETADFGRVATSEGGVLELGIVNYDDSGRTVGEILEQPENVQATVLPHPTSLEPAWLVDVRIPAGLDPGVVRGDLRIGTRLPNGSEGTPLTVPVRALVVPDIATSSPQIGLRPVDGGVGHELEVFARDSRRTFRIVEGRVTGEMAGHLDVTIEAQEPDADGAARRWAVRVSGGSFEGLDALPSGSLVLDLDDPDTPRIELPITTVNLH
ncbi:MAG: DUF1573 domain-containing protein [Planctomycetota bacterium]